MTEEQLTAIEARATAATREPWIVGDMYVPTACLSAVSVYGMGMEVAECQSDADGAFIAAARVDVPALVAEVRRLRAQVAVVYGHDYAKANRTYTGPCPMCQRGCQHCAHMSYLAQWVSELAEGHTITADDVKVLARVQQCILASDKHHQQARDAQANAAEKVVVSRAVEFVDAVTLYDEPGVLLDAHIELRVAVAHLLAVEAAS